MARNMFGLVCPGCGDGGSIDVGAVVWVRLTRRGSDPDASGDGTYDWDNDSVASCCGCGWVGVVKELKEDGGSDDHD